VNRNMKPPRFAKWLFDRIVTSDEKRTISGDMDEWFHQIAWDRGRLRAFGWYWGHLVCSIPVLITNSIYWSLAMLKNYLLIALRVIRKHKGYAFINITGLAIGITICILILLFVHNELTYDRHHEKANQIYRVALRGNIGANKFDVPNGPTALADALRNDYPEVISAVRLFRVGQVQIRYEDRVFREERFILADSTVFDVFTIPLVQGDMNTALDNPNSVVLTTETAQKYFGDIDPLGKTLTFEDGTLYTVTGLAPSMPQNSHLKFDFLASFSTREESRDPNWGQNIVYTYIVLHADASEEELAAKLPDLARKYIGPIIEEALSIPYDQFLEAGNFFGFFLQPLLDIHLHSNLGNELEPSGNVSTVILFSAIAFIIFFVACINFINLATARSAMRANEVGVRKVVGSNRGQLVRQFLTESIFLSAMAMLIAVLLVYLLLPSFNNLVGKQFTASFLTDVFFIMGIVIAVFVVGIIAGTYPAFLLSSFQPISVLKGKVQSGIKGRRFRYVLVVFQFSASIILFIGTLVVYQQLRFIRNKDLGFDKEHVIVIQDAEKLASNQQAYKSAIKKSPSILDASYSNGLPQMHLSGQGFQKENATGNESHILINLVIDYDFIDTYRIQMAQGRYFSPDRGTDSTAVIVNRATVQALEMTHPLEERLLYLEEEPIPLSVIGVFEDFHLESLHEAIRPMVATLVGEGPMRFLSVRVRPGMIEEALNVVESQWNAFVPGQPLEYAFFDDRFDRLYRSEIQAGKVLSSFAMFAIFIACLGLFGLSAFTTVQRTKEIGVRKVLGASIPSILILLARDFVKWVLVANVFAWPIAYYVTTKWLQSFAYRIHIGIVLFVLSGLLALFIALVTVSYQCLRVAHSNPVDSLRYE